MNKYNSNSTIHSKVDRVFGYDGSPLVAIPHIPLCIYPRGTSVGLSITNNNNNNNKNNNINNIISQSTSHWSIGDGTHKVTCVAAHPSGNIIIVAQLSINVSLFAYTFPDRKLKQEISNVGKVQVEDISFSRCGAFMAVLSGPPECALSIYKINNINNNNNNINNNQGDFNISLYISRTQQFGYYLKKVSFSPFQPDILCSTGGNHVVFWSINNINNNNNNNNNIVLSPLEGDVVEEGVRITCHQFMPNGSVICGTDSSGLFVYDDFTSPIGVPLLDNNNNNNALTSSSPSKEILNISNVNKSMDIKSIISLCLNRLHLAVLVRKEEGTIIELRNIDNIHSVMRVISVPCEKPTCMIYNSDKNSILVGSTCGALQEVIFTGLEKGTTHEEFNNNINTSIVTICRGFGDELIGGGHLDGASGGRVAVVNRNGALTIIDYINNEILAQWHVGPVPNRCISIPNTQIICIISDTGAFRAYDYTDYNNPREVLCGKFSDQPIILIEVDPNGKYVAFSDGNVIYFCILKEKENIINGQMQMELEYLGTVTFSYSSAIVAMAFVPKNNNTFILSFSSGDTTLFTIPTEAHFTENSFNNREIDSSVIYINTWLIDMTVCTLCVTGVHEDNMVIMVHGVDKVGRLYLLDTTLNPERKDREVRAIKPQVLLHDHSKKGTRIVMYRDKLLLSTALDGKLIIRDATPYTVHLNVQPTNKERAEPIAILKNHVSIKGGIATVIYSETQQRIITIGSDGVVLVYVISMNINEKIPVLPLVTTKVKVPVDAVLSPVIDEDIFYTEKVTRDLVMVDSIINKGHREGVKARILALREKLVAIRHENEMANQDESVPLRDFLVARHQEAFDRAVEDAIADMRVEVENANLYRDYVTDVLRRECWDIMEVKCTPLIGMYNKQISVYNFHYCHDDPELNIIVRKLKFLRLVEMTDRRVRKVSELTDINECKTDKSGEGEFDRPVGVTPSEAEEVNDVADHVEDLLCRTVKDQASLDPEYYLYNTMLLFTRNRSIIQKILLDCRIKCLKKSYNRHFDEMVEKKNQLVFQIKENNIQSRLILNELKEEREIFLPKMEICENPAHIFDVDETTVNADKSSDPVEKARLAQAEIERQRWIERHGNDDSYQKALVLWMDGRLDRDTHTMEINITKPEFAEETSEKYIPPDERNDAQNRIYKDYETALAKRIEEINTRREELNEQFEKIQKNNINIAIEFDITVGELAAKRLIISQNCFHVELQQVKLVQSVLTHEERQNIARKMQKRTKKLDETLRRVSEINKKKVTNYERIAHELDTLQSEERQMEHNIRQEMPFTDPEYGELFLRYNIKKNKTLKRKANELLAMNTAINEKDNHNNNKELIRTGSANANTISPLLFNPDPTLDPFAIIENKKATKLAKKNHKNAILLKTLEHRPGELAHVPDTLWEDFLAYRQEHLRVESDITEVSEEMSEVLSDIHVYKDKLERITRAVEESTEEFNKYIHDALVDQYDIHEIHIFQQGQIEVSTAPVVTDYTDAILINSSHIARFNDLIRDSTAEKLLIIEELMNKRTEMRLIEWEVEHLIYVTKTLQMQLHQLHTLRVTKEMQAFINGGGEHHNETQVRNLKQKIDYVRKNMAQKIEDRREEMKKIRNTIKDKEIENYILLDQVGDAQGTVDTRQAIYNLQSSGLGTDHCDKLMRDMRRTMLLKDYTNIQECELVKLKREVDRLRERTFPSFAIVTKRVVGSPDQK